MAFDKGFNFRATSGYVTDGANETYVTEDAYPTTRNGVTFGWESGFDAGNSRNRSTTIDVRLAGMNFEDNGTAAEFRVDLPNSGNFNLTLAMGDASFASSNKAVFKDTTTALVTLQDTTVAGGSFMDAAQSELTAANWPGSNTPYAATFSTTIFRTRIGRESVGAGDNSTIAHLFVSEVAASASITPPVGGGVLASIAGRMDLGMPVPSAVRIQ